MHMTVNAVFDPFTALSWDSWYCENIDKKYMKLEEITCIEIFMLKFIVKRHILHIAHDQLPYWNCAVGARTMHSFGTDLVRNRAI